MKNLLQKLDLIGLLLLVAAAVWYFITKIGDIWNTGLAIAGVLCLIAGVIFNFRQILTTMGKRSTKYAINYMVSVILVIAVVAGLNYIGQKYTQRFDLTSSGLHTMAPQTVKVLKNLAQDIDIKAFFSGGEHGPLKELFTEYRTLSSHIKYEFIDPDREPEIARQNEVEVYGAFQNPLTGQQINTGTVIVSSGDRSEKIEKRTGEVLEQDLTNAIIKALRTEIPKIYFVQGHGEKDPADNTQFGYSEAQRTLEEQGYQVDSLNLVEQGRVPEDAQVIILAGPEVEPFPQELEFINDFLGNGGGAFILVDPAPSPSLETYLKDWGVDVQNNLVLDVSGVGQLMGAGPEIPLVSSYEDHIITDRFSHMTFFPMTRSIHPMETLPEGVTVETLFTSNPNSWGETNLDTPEAQLDPETDLVGPLPLAVAVTKEIKPSTEDTPALNARMVVTGTSRFPTNTYFGAQGNGNMFLNMVSWLAQDNDLISIRPKSPDDRKIFLSEGQSSTIFILSIFILPGIALVIGIVVYVNRRRR